MTDSEDADEQGEEVHRTDSSSTESEENDENVNSNQSEETTGAGNEYEGGISDSPVHTGFDVPVQTARLGVQLKELRQSLATDLNLRSSLSGINQMQRSVEEATEPLREMQQSIQAATQPFEDLQQTVSAVQSARAIVQAYNQQWSVIRETLLELRESIRVAVEEQIELEMPWDYDSVEPDPAAKAAAESWAEHFIEDFEDVEDEYFERLIGRVEDGLEEFQDEPERPYAAIHIFISMQDALLWWLCYQDDEMSTEATNEIGLPKFGTDDKQNALRKYYGAYFGVENDEPARLSDYKWDCFWAHRHAIMHGDLYATYDMNIATTAFFALAAHSVLRVIEDRDEAGEDIPSIIDEIEEAQEAMEPEDVDPGEVLGMFAGQMDES
jgi:prefoldin subunit 5